MKLKSTASITDAGHDSLNWERAPWALNSQGNLNYPLIFNFASLAVHDMTTIGKAITAQYYGGAPKFSYWNGCSTGGRQGVMSAQRYPEDYDGILAGAPAVNLPDLSISTYWPQSVMDRLGVYPPKCELDFINAQAVAACDELDGVKDGVIGDPDKCNFDPLTIVGQKIDDCNGTSITVSREAASVAKAVWDGPASKDGKSLFVGVARGTPFTGRLALANTACEGGGKTGCSGRPFLIAVDWIKLMVKRDPNYDVKGMTLPELEGYYYTNRQQLNSIIGANDPDLSRFKSLGKKMISWHGLSDECITMRNSRLYYDKVLAGDSSATDYYRHFEAPGVNHCAGGVGKFYPLKALDALRRWVEGGIVPEVLTGYKVTNGSVGLGSESGPTRPLCMYPKVLRFNGGDANAYSSFACVDRAPADRQKDEL
jgi:hypothetical protein